MRLLAKPMGYLLMWLYEFIGNYGISLIIVTLVVKLCLYPLYAKQIISSAKMSKLNPKIREIQQKYAKDQMLMNEKLQELYEREGVKMSAGCLPMIVQMFIIMALFGLLRNPMLYFTGDNADMMLFAIHEPFLWIKDLAQPDKWILPIAAGIATYISFTMNQKNSLNGANNPSMNQMNVMNKLMQYIFPITILLMARSYPAGLAIYWFFSQVIQIFYNIRFNQLRKKLNEEDAPKGKKKSKARA
ncbi:MAG: YidC/Oxa1 family membrane protein insertase [Firmicutes bacterium]|nr:YidC/Oxa1 family membrane protein insertase [Bacillota bacterium]MDD7601161.1 YidC/Oxa1 family membrane protein insertase [Bacillota bacterium]MDY5857125.1 YidC/Oxa1 family membrane protein insertase [Anaerovoracaceae bacterium]